MSTNSLLIFNLILLAVVLESDLGRRKISAFRVLRPLIGAAVIIPFFVATPAVNGWGLGLELAGVALGAALGLTAASLLSVEWDPETRRAYTRAGLGYAALWVAVSAARYGFAYGAQHVFARPLGEFMAANKVTPGVLADALIFVFVTMYLIRTVSLVMRRSTVSRAKASALPSDQVVAGSQRGK